MLVIPGVEITKDYLDAGRSAHLLLIDVQEFVPASWDYERIFAAARAQDALVIACHPHHMSARTRPRHPVPLEQPRALRAPHRRLGDRQPRRRLRRRRAEAVPLRGEQRLPPPAPPLLLEDAPLVRAHRPARSRAACARTAAWPSRCSGAEAEGREHMELPLMVAAVVVAARGRGAGAPGDRAARGRCVRGLPRPVGRAGLAAGEHPQAARRPRRQPLRRTSRASAGWTTPRYEVIFCLRSANDPAHAVAAGRSGAPPRRPISILVSTDGDGCNPKVRNMLPGYRAARHDVLLVSDSNVEAPPAYLRETVRPLLEPGVGLVTNPIRGRGARSLGAALENLHLNTFVAGGDGLPLPLPAPAVRGRQVDALHAPSSLEALGGLAAFRDVLAEDFVIGREIYRAGRRVELGPCAGPTSTSTADEAFSEPPQPLGKAAAAARRPAVPGRVDREPGFRRGAARRCALPGAASLALLGAPPRPRPAPRRLERAACSRRGCRSRAVPAARR